MLSLSFFSDNAAAFISFKVIKTTEFALSRKKGFYRFPEFLVASNVFHIKITLVIPLRIP